MQGGVFLTFEGGEGAGKTTLIDGIERHLTQHGANICRTREPGGTALSEHIREWLLNKDFSVAVGDKAELMLFLAARMQNIEEVILPALQHGKVVLCDRFNDSTVAYQGYGRALGGAWVKEVCDAACGGLTPTLTFLLDIPPEEGLARTEEVDRIEGEALCFHEAVRQGYRALAAEEPERFCVLDALLPPEEVLKQAVQKLDRVLV